MRREKRSLNATINTIEMALKYVVLTHIEYDFTRLAHTTRNRFEMNIHLQRRPNQSINHRDTHDFSPRGAHRLFSLDHLPRNTTQLQTRHRIHNRGIDE
ncbi:hypothetical protein D3C76_1334530 [compost metagenome]